jgi:hypothetical protein
MVAAYKSRVNSPNIGAQRASPFLFIFPPSILFLLRRDVRRPSPRPSPRPSSCNRIPVWRAYNDLGRPSDRNTVEAQLYAYARVRGRRALRPEGRLCRAAAPRSPRRPLVLTVGMWIVFEVAVLALGWMHLYGLATSFAFPWRNPMGRPCMHMLFCCATGPVLFVVDCVCLGQWLCGK